MDWQMAITRNREALLSIVAALMVSVGLSTGCTLTTLPHHLYRQALLLLRQAESAVRRLIMIAAHGLPLRGYTPPKPRSAITKLMRPLASPPPRLPTFNLIDPLKTFGNEAPDLGRIFGNSAAANNALVPAASFGRRILALKLALESIPQQAKRLARWYETRDFVLRQNRTHRISPIRPGPPPASRQQSRTEMDAVLRECHTLAIYIGERRDSP